MSETVIILSVGMAVDANVIIFTRIKEEIGLGHSVKSAIKAGFSKALSAIPVSYTHLERGLLYRIVGICREKGSS